MACNLVKLGRDLKHDLGPQKVATRKGNALISGKSTLPETNSSPLQIGHLKRKRSYSNHPFSGAFAVSFSEGIILPECTAAILASMSWSL